jgi:type II secretory pathway component GspD/PulD (secretin)
MPARTPLDALVRDLEQASGTKVTISDQDDHVRVSVPAPAERETYRAVLDVLSRAAWWGSTDGTGELRLWGAVRKDRGGHREHD